MTPEIRALADQSFLPFDQQRNATPEQLAEGHLALVARIANSVTRPPGVTWSELFAAGSEALVIAANRWEWTGRPFAAYARSFVRSAILDACKGPATVEGDLDDVTGENPLAADEGALAALDAEARELVERTLLDNPREPISRVARSLGMGVVEAREVLAASIEKIRLKSV